MIVWTGGWAAKQQYLRRWRRYQCGNTSTPLQPDWKEVLAAAASSVMPFVLNRTVVGIFYGAYQAQRRGWDASGGVWVDR